MTRRLARTHPDATGGRTPRPCDKVLARKMWSTRRILIVDMADTLLDEADPIYLTDLARRLGITGKRTKSRSKRTSAAVDAAEAVFRTDTGDETQRASRGEIGGQGDG